MSLLNHPFDPEHDAALVTGAGNGIGRAIAQALVAEGVRTMFVDVREDKIAAAIASSARPDSSTTHSSPSADPRSREPGRFAQVGWCTHDSADRE